jgi:hypothetical protein
MKARRDALEAITNSLSYAGITSRFTQIMTSGYAALDSIVGVGIRCRLGYCHVTDAAGTNLRTTASKRVVLC